VEDYLTSFFGSTDILMVKEIELDVKILRKKTLRLVHFMFFL